jgi:HK97 family phage portal protein
MQVIAGELQGNKELASAAFNARVIPSVAYTDPEVAWVGLTEDQAKQIKQAFLAATSGTSREPAVLGSGLKHEAIQVNPDDSQFIDLLRLEVENTCRFFGVPPSMVYGAVSGQNVTYANVAQADLAFLKHGLDPRLVRIERALSRLLPGGQTVKFNRDALLRADTASRYAQHAVALKNKFRTVNEVRRIEDERPFDDPIYDEPGLPGGADVAAHEAAPGDPAEDSSPQEQNS